MARPPLPQTIKAKDAEIARLRGLIEAVLDNERRRIEAALFYASAARTLMEEALIRIPYHAQTDLRREWLKRWPWLEEANGAGNTLADRAGGGPEGSGPAQRDDDS